jgi:hypothetical protein
MGGLSSALPGSPPSPAEPVDRYVARLGRSAPAAARTLARRLGLSRAAAAEAFAGAGSLVVAGLARHGRRRGPGAVRDVLAKYARPADLGAPALAVGAHLSRPDLSARLGGLLGDGGPRFCGWLASRRRADAGALERALAACAPLALGALDECLGSEGESTLPERFPEDVLDEPSRLVGGDDPSARLFRRLARSGLPWFARVLSVR